MTEQKQRPSHEIAMIDRARPIVIELTDSALDKLPGNVDEITAEHLAALTDGEAIALLTNMFARELYENRPKYGEGPQVCGWCIDAAGGGQEAWDATPKMTLAEVREHTLTCEHNPLVARVRELQDAITAVMNSADDAIVAVHYPDQCPYHDTDRQAAGLVCGKCDSVEPGWIECPEDVTCSCSGPKVMRALAEVVGAQRCAERSVGGSR